MFFYNKVWDEWKRLASENKDQTWQKLESEWNDYIEEYNLLYFSGRSRKRKLNNGMDPEDMPSLSTKNVSEMMLVNNEDYQPDCPWKMFDNNEIDEPRQNLNRVSYGNDKWDNGEIEGCVTVNSNDSKIISFLGDKCSELVEITHINDCTVNM
jgi:hypothetical protein